MPKKSPDVAPKPTIRDVAEHAGVSKSLVSLVIGNAPHVSDRRRAAVLRAMEELGYKPNRNARNLARSKTQTIGVVISDMDNPWYIDFLDGFDGRLRSAGFNALLGNGRGDAGVQLDLLETFLGYGVDGICLGGTFREPQRLERLIDTVPAAVIHNLEIHGSNSDVIVSDNAAGAWAAVTHLINLGHRRIAHITGPGGVSRERRKGYERAMVEHDLDDQMSVVETDFSPRRNASAAHELLAMKARPTAVFAVNDLVGIAVLDATRALGLDVPRDLSLIGFDNTRYAALSQVSMSSVDNDNIHLGEKAADLLLARVAGDHVHASPAERSQPTLIVRSSSARPHQLT